MGGYIGKGQGVVLVDGYTQAETNTLLGNKANSADVYTTSQVDSAIAANTEVTRSASAPSSPTAGDLWFDTSTNIMKVYSGTAWDQMSNKFSATGGTITTYNGYKYHTFTSSGTFTADATGTVEYLMVAGGGGTANTGPTGTYPQAWSGGGGAGGLLQSSTQISTGSHTVTVGSGGGTASQGGSSSFNSITAVGGGYGGNYSQPGGSGGSGGGGGGDITTSGGSGTSGQGYAGGAGYDPTPEGGGGGGGAGSTGAQGRSGGSGGGGQGAQYSTWATATSTGDNGYYASGGGGGPGTQNASLTPDVDGGGGRGASGYYQASYNDAENGQANTGGGGGGGNRTGGSGIVIIRYPI